MPKRITPLTDAKIRTIKPTEKPQKLFDGGGLFLLITPTGGKLWQLKYRFGSIEKLLAIGAYPQISLAEARQKRDQASALMLNGVDPGDTKKAQKAAGNQEAETFEGSIDPEIISSLICQKSLGSFCLFCRLNILTFEPGLP